MFISNTKPARTDCGILCPCKMGSRAEAAEHSELAYLFVNQPHLLLTEHDQSYLYPVIFYNFPLGSRKTGTYPRRPPAKSRLQCEGGTGPSGLQNTCLPTCLCTKANWESPVSWFGFGSQEELAAAREMPWKRGGRGNVQNRQKWDHSQIYTSNPEALSWKC